MVDLKKSFEQQSQNYLLYSINKLNAVTFLIWSFNIYVKPNLKKYSFFSKMMNYKRVVIKRNTCKTIYYVINKL